MRDKTTMTTEAGSVQLMKRETILQLAHELKQAGVDKETGVTLSLMVRRSGGAEQLMDWMERNPQAPLEALYNKAWEIQNATKPDEHRNTAS